MARNLVVLVPTSERLSLVERTLSSLKEVRKPSIYRETVLIENGRRQLCEGLARDFRESLNLRYLYLPDGNKSNALNTALESIQDALVFFTDDDVRFDPSVLGAYADAASGKHGGEFYGGPFGVDYDEAPPPWLVEFLPSSAVGWSLGDQPRIIGKGNAFLGFNWAAFADDLKRLGGFSIHHGPGSRTKAVGQETEMQGRLLDNRTIGRYVPGALVWHYVPPERCSRRFAALRAYRWGIQSGLKSEDSWVTLSKRWTKSGVKSLLKILSRDPAEFFRPYYQFRFNTGLVRGRMIRLNRGL
ncbi:MAG: glycosyltransferase [Desulfobacterales bacterium]